MNKNRKTLLSIFCFVLILSPALSACQQTTVTPQQQIDTNFNSIVLNPAYTDTHPVVFIDEAHDNFHTVEGTYKPFADLLTNDGYNVVANKEPFTTKILEGCNILVISNALGVSGKSAFTEAECDAVALWVREGGSLLLIADHAPYGGAAQTLADIFGVNMNQGGTVDQAHADTQNGGNSGWLIFSRENGLLAEHPITEGRNPSEIINTVETFAGQSLKGPEGSIAFLQLADTAVDINTANGEVSSAAGRAQGIALEFGKGKVVVLGEAGMMTAQLRGSGIKAGMNRAGNDDKQLALNIMHWLSGLLDTQHRN